MSLRVRGLFKLITLYYCPNNSEAINSDAPLIKHHLQEAIHTY